MALSNKQILRKLKKIRKLEKKYVITFSPEQYRIFAERTRITPAHVIELNELAHEEDLFFFRCNNGIILFGRAENFRQVVFEMEEDID
jgi:hypothetical protein